jgi:hypothetical protein
MERSRYFKMFHVEQFGLADETADWARASRGSAARIVPRREIVPRGTIVKTDTGVWRICEELRGDVAHLWAAGGAVGLREDDRNFLQIFTRERRPIPTQQ